MFEPFDSVEQKERDAGRICVTLKRQTEDIFLTLEKYDLVEDNRGKNVGGLNKIKWYLHRERNGKRTRRLRRLSKSDLFLRLVYHTVKDRGLFRRLARS